jgi:hypothetical protein
VAIVAIQKVALSGLGRKWYEKVDKKIDNNKSKDLGTQPPEKVMKMTSSVELHALKCQHHCLRLFWNVNRNSPKRSTEPLWRAKKSNFHASGKTRMKKVEIW